MPENNWDDEDYDDDDDDEYNEEYNEEDRQDCFNLIVASFISSIWADDSTIENDEDKPELVDQILTILEEHLDEKGLEYLTNAFLKFEKEYFIQAQTHEIISSFEWNKEKND